MTKPRNGYAIYAPFPTNHSKGSKGRLSLGGVQGQSPCWGLGQSPNLPHRRLSKSIRGSTSVYITSPTICITSPSSVKMNSVPNITG